jgi:predicted Zn-dependent protease
MTTTQTVQTVEDLFDQGLERYKAGESVETLIPVFKDVCDRSRTVSAAWTCLSWLYLLADKPELALTTAQKAVKLNPQDPQARLNLSVAMLDSGKKGVRSHVEITQQIIMVSEELHEEVFSNIEDGLTRKPEWKSLLRVKAWLTE